MRHLYSSAVADIALEQGAGTCHHDDSEWNSDPMAAAIRREERAERDWEAGVSHLSREDYVSMHTF